MAAIERQLLEIYADPSVAAKPALLEQRGGAYYSEAAVELMTSLLGDHDGVHVVDLRNDGTLPFLPDAAVIEVPARVGPQGPVAEAVMPSIRCARDSSRTCLPMRNWRSKPPCAAAGNASSGHCSRIR